VVCRATSSSSGVRGRIVCPLTTFLLVHGAWHGGWCWQRVKAVLEAGGHRVLTPCLSGLGSRCHLLSAENDLTLHIQDVQELIRREELSDFVLCGHSYGGLVVGSVAVKEAEKLKALVYLDAYVPLHGLSGLDLRSDEANRRLLKTVQGGWLMPAPGAASFGLSVPRDVQWVDSSLCPMALGCFSEKAVLTRELPEQIRMAYIRTNWPNPSMDRFYEKAREWKWMSERWDCGHDMMVECPDRTAQFLESVSKP
jgi:pimeloyl-ACP methyl ester carboxylesterase